MIGLMKINRKDCTAFVSSTLKEPPLLGEKAHIVIFTTGKWTVMRAKKKKKEPPQRVLINVQPLHAKLRPQKVDVS